MPNFREIIEEQTRKANDTWVKDPNTANTKRMETTCQKLLQIFLSTGQLEITSSYASDIITGSAAQEAARAAAVAAKNPIPLPDPLAPPTLPPADLPPMEAPTIPDNHGSAAATTMGGKVSAEKTLYGVVSVLEALGILTKVGSSSYNLKWTFYLNPDEIAQYGVDAGTYHP